MSAAEEDFIAALRARVAEALDRRPSSFAQLVRDCDGAYPTEVRKTLADIGHPWGKDLPVPESDYSGKSELEKLPANPARCSWYFAESTCKKLGMVTPWAGKTIGFLGCPQLFAWFSSASLGEHRALFDVDDYVLKHLRRRFPKEGRIVHYDAEEDLPREWRSAFDVVFFDPPWYPFDYRLWLGRVSQMLNGGLAVFSLFPALTRPSAALERKKLLAKLGRASSDYFLLEGFVTYGIPSFENEELRQQGIELDEPWKKSDLVLLLDPQFSPVTRVGRRSHWEELEIGTVRVFIDLSARVHGAALLEAPTGGSYLQSPSRREVNRRCANVLTSNGRAFVSGDPQLLYDSLSRLLISKDASQGVQPSASVADLLESEDMVKGFIQMLETHRV